MTSGASSGGARPRPTRARRLRRLGGIGLIVPIAVVIPAGFIGVEEHLSWKVPPALPPVADPSALPPAGPSVLLHLHVHTERSHDAEGTIAEVAEAAERQGVDAVWLSDHLPRGDAPPADPLLKPHFVAGILVGDGRETDLAGGLGRVLVFGADSLPTTRALDLAVLREYLRGDTTALAVVAHGRGARPRDMWHAGYVPEVHGWEALNVSDAARRRVASAWAPWHLALAVGGLPFGRFHEALARSFGEGFDDPGVVKYDSLARSGPLTALGAGNVHPKTRAPVLGLVPGYDHFFRAVNNRVYLETPLSDDPIEAEAAVNRAIRAGRVVVAVRHGPDSESFVLRAGDASEAVGPGGRLTFRPGLRLRAGFADGAPGRALVWRVVRDGSDILVGRGSDLDVPIDEPGVYRVEVERYRFRLGNLMWGRRPWLLANPVRVDR